MRIDKRIDLRGARKHRSRDPVTAFALLAFRLVSNKPHQSVKRPAF